MRLLRVATYRRISQKYPARELIYNRSSFVSTLPFFKCYAMPSSSSWSARATLIYPTIVLLVPPQTLCLIGVVVVFFLAGLCSHGVIKPISISFVPQTLKYPMSIPFVPPILCPDGVGLVVGIVRIIPVFIFIILIIVIIVFRAVIIIVFGAVIIIVLRAVIIIVLRAVIAIVLGRLLVIVQIKALGILGTIKSVTIFDAILLLRYQY
jgi:hypothetical protein